MKLQSGEKHKLREQNLTFLVMSSHWVPFPEAGAPDIIIFKGSDLADATTRLELEEALGGRGAWRQREAACEVPHTK